MESSCKLTGMYCQRIPIPVSPRKLREAYEYWNRSSGKDLNPIWSSELKNKRLDGYQNLYMDIHLIYPMLKDRCLGKTKGFPSVVNEIDRIDDGRKIEWFYIYGPCRFFERDKITYLGICAIQDHKPWMCSSYPNGGLGTFKGCGFNLKHPEHGIKFDILQQQLVPLEDEEK